MTINSLAPGFAKISYVQNLLTHVKTIPLLPSGTITPGVEPSVMTYAGTPITFSAAIDALIALMQPIYGADTSFSSAEFWSQPLSTDNPVWVFTHPIGEVGTATGASADKVQSVMTFRTGIGGLYRDYQMEISGDVPADLHVFYPFSAGPFANLAAYLTGTTSWTYARDGSRLIVPVAFTTKVNDALRKKRLNL